MSVDAPQETYKPFIPTSYNADNDFGFGNMQTTPEEDYENEPPLLEELGIDFSHIYNKIWVVLNPRARIDSVLSQDADLTGPILFCFLIALLLLLRGRVQFGYTYGFFFAGCFLIYLLIGLLNDSATGVTLSSITSILGYSIIPIVLLSGVSLVIPAKSIVSYILAIFCCLWSAFSASRFIEILIGSKDQRYIIMYPLILLYATFTLLT
ncbi:hypothetical protein WA556_006101, partial [Blastocystis sp. ATCC 50177/Nand II]